MLNSSVFLKNLSTCPGVYQILSKEGRVLYVGKAQNLKKRLSSYFRSRLDSEKTRSLMQYAFDIKIIITRSDTEALLLENNLIKKLKPRYNILLRDSKSYPTIYFSNHNFPRIAYYRGKKTEEGRYFGPYPNVNAARETLTFLQKIFKIRTCTDVFFRHRSRPCLLYQLQRCSAPCVNLIDALQYDQSVRYAILFLEGKSDSIITEISQKMDTASALLQFELASKYRDQISMLRKIQENQSMDLKAGEIDVIVLLRRYSHICIEVLTIRSGRLLGSKAHFFELNKDFNEDFEIITHFLSQYYLQFNTMLPNKILLNIKLLDSSWIQNSLSEILAKKIEIKTPLRGSALRWIKMALTNAEHALTQHLSENNYLKKQFSELRLLLKIKNNNFNSEKDFRIECFDVSHTNGEKPVVSCVVFNKNGPLKQAYKYFNITGITPGDDYAALKSALLRRFKNPRENSHNFPSVLVIDGGKGQLSQAKTTLKELEIQGISLIGVAKGEGRKPGLEKLFINNQLEPVSLAADTPVLHLIQYIRDEAHRFAITGHRKKRAKARQTSVLNQIPGIGPSKCRELLRHFGGLQGIKSSTQEELAKVQGIGPILGELVYRFFHGE